MKPTRMLLAQGDLALIGRGAVGKDVGSSHTPFSFRRRPCTRSPTSTIGRWLMHVPWLERRNFVSLYSCRLAVVVRDSDGAARPSWSTTPSPSREDDDARSPCRSYTPYRCRRSAPRGGAAERPDAACSRPSGRGSRRRSRRNGIIAVATETIIRGEISI